jgi:hypothetical protein
MQLFRGMSNLGFDISIENILFGNASFENDKNSKLFYCHTKQDKWIRQWQYITNTDNMNNYYSKN